MALVTANLIWSQKAIWVGETYKCDATSAVLGLTSDVTWTTSGGYLSLSGSGFYRNVTATQYWSGTATVKCTWKYRLYSGDTWKTQSRSWTLTCIENPVSIYPTNMTLPVGGTGYVSYSHQYNNSYLSAANPYFSSSNNSIATVSSDGKVTGIKPGTCYITVYSKVSAASNAPSCKVTVEDVNPTGVSLPDNLSLYIEETKPITPTVTPTGANTTYTWWSDNESVAKVSSSGNVTGISEGSTKVWVKTNVGGYTDYCTVSVREPELSLVSWSPQNATDVPTTSRMSATFSLDLYKGTNFSDISLKNTDKGTNVSGTVSISGKTLTFIPEDELESNTNYLFSVPANSLKNKWGTAYAYPVTIKFKTSIRPSDIKYLTVWTNDGGTTAFPLEEHPNLTFNAEEGSVLCKTSSQEISFLMNDVHKYTLDYLQNPTSGISVTPSKEEGNMVVQPSNLLFDGFAPNTVISVFAINGLLVDKQKTNADGRLSIQMNNWPGGIYIIKAGSVTYKITKK